MKPRNIDDAIKNATKLEKEIPFLTQPEVTTYDLITLKNEVYRLNHLLSNGNIIWIQTSNSTNIICGIWKSEPTIEQRIVEYSAYLEKEVTFEDVKCNTILKEYKVNI